MSAPTFHLLPATAADLEAILEIESASFHHPWGLASFEAELAQAGSHLLVLHDEGRAQPVIGYLCYRFIFDEAHLFNIAVAQPWRRKGLGRLMMDHLMEHARQQESGRITLEVARHNAAAVRLYERYGFEPAGLRRDYYGHGRDALILWLDLNRRPNAATEAR